MAHISTSSPASFLQNCFVIFDADSVGAENATEDDVVLYFYPPGVGVDLKFFLTGWCTAMINFTKNFTNHPLEVAILEKFKVSFKQIGAITMALTGPVDLPDSTVLSHLEMIYSAFRFYNRSFKAVLENNVSRKELLQKMEQIGKELEPLITRNFNMNILRSFNPIPYTPLVHKANRHFIQASQLLNFVKMKPGNLSGCVMYKRSVVCTHLDFITTRWILNWIDYNKSSRNNAQSSYSNLPIRGRADPTFDFIPVYMFRDDIDRLIRERENMFPFANIQNNNPPVTSSPFTPPVFKPSFNVEEDEEDLDGFISLGLCIVSVNELAVAILMTFKAFANEQHIKRSFGKIIHQFQALESDLETAYTSNPSPTSPGLGGSGGGGGGGGSSLRLGSSQQGLSYHNARTVASTNYNFLTYDSLTESATTTPITSPQDDFAQSASFQHHIFLQDPSVSQIISKDNLGEIFGKQVFGREVYYQLKNSANMSHDKFLEVIEKTVRSTLKDDHNINMI